MAWQEKRRLAHLLLVAAILTVCARRGSAEDRAAPIAEVVVTATRTSASADDAAASVTVIDRAEIDRRAGSSTTEALRGTAGIDLTEFGSPGQASLATVRGAAFDEVLVMIDGVEVNTPSAGQFDLANLSNDNVERIEVVRGAGGSLYGAQAIGGVVNLLSARGSGPLSLSVSGEAGSGTTHRETIGLQGEHGRFSIAGSVTNFMTDGFQPVNDDHRNLSTAWRGDVDVIDGGTFTGVVRYATTRTGLPNFQIAEQRLDEDARRRTDFFLAKGEWAHVVGPLDYRFTASYVSSNERTRDDEADPEEPGETEIRVLAHIPSEIVAGEAQANYSFGDVALTTVGAEVKERSAHIYKQQRDTEVDEDGEVSEEVEIEDFRANRTSFGLYAQQQLHLLERVLNAVAAVRYDRYDVFGDEVTVSGSASYRFAPTGTQIRAGYGEGFRVPSFDELFELGLGNPNLKPEHSWEVHAGPVQEAWDGRLRLEATFFHREVTDFIAEVADQLPSSIAGVPESASNPLTRNLDATFDGVDTTLALHPLPWLHAEANYMYLETSTGGSGVVNNEADNFKALLYRPHHRGAVTVTAIHDHLLSDGDRASVALRVSSVGRRLTADPQNDFEGRSTPGYARVDLYLNYRLGGSWSPVSINASVRNLFDRNYEESIGFPAPPLRVLAGLRYDL